MTTNTPITNQLFQQLIPDFAHLLTTDPMTKEEFAEAVKTSYDISNPKTSIFYTSIGQCTFDSIRLNNNRNTILLNQ